MGELEARQRELDRDKKVIAYCRSGHRSMGAAIALCGLVLKVEFYSQMMSAFRHEEAKHLCERLVHKELKHKQRLELF